MKITPTLGAVGLSNPSFETFDAGALNEGDAEYGKAPTGAFWKFTQMHPMDEVGISVIAGVIGPGLRRMALGTQLSSTALATASRSR